MDENENQIPKQEEGVEEVDKDEVIPEEEIEEVEKAVEKADKELENDHA